MVSARQRTKVAALSLAAASLGSNHAVDAFYSSSTSTSTNPLAFAPLRAQPWLARSHASHHSTASLSATGRPHRLHVRGRSGLESGSCWRSERPAGVSVSRAARRTWGGALGSQRVSKLSMSVVEDAGETSASEVSRGNASACVLKKACVSAWMPAMFERMRRVQHRNICPRGHTSRQGSMHRYSRLDNCNTTQLPYPRATPAVRYVLLCIREETCPLQTPEVTWC